MKKVVACFVLLLVCSQVSVAATRKVVDGRISGRCGLVQSYLLHSEGKTNIRGGDLRGLARLRSAGDICASTDLADSVQVRFTNHFRIYYTRAGVHRVLDGGLAETEEFVDSTAAVLERAWTFYADSLGMKTPSLPDRSVFWQREERADLLPVEILDISSYDNSFDWGYYGLMMPSDPSGKAGMLIENDFLTGRPENRIELRRSVLSENGNDTICFFLQAEDTLTGPEVAGRTNYRSQWEKALQVTLAHELYHAFQIGYLDFRKTFNFWFEAGATGMENIHYPEVNDYLQYLPSVFEETRISLTDSTPSSNRMYGQSVFLHFLQATRPRNFEQRVWEHLEGTGGEVMGRVFRVLLKEDGLSLDSLFHDFALHLFFSKERSVQSPLSAISEDPPLWPKLAEVVVSSGKSSGKIHLQALSFSLLELEDFGFGDSLYPEFPDTLQAPVRASLISLPEEGLASGTRLQNGSLLAKSDARHFLLVSNGSAEDGLDFALLSYGNGAYALRFDNLPESSGGFSGKAWPNPFRPFQHRQVCFHVKKGQSVRIFGPAGNVLAVVKSNGQGRTCWDGRNRAGSLFASGVYRYLSSGKQPSKLILIH